MRAEELKREEEAAWRRYLKAEVKRWSDTLADHLRKDWSGCLKLEVVSSFMYCNRQAEARLWQCKNKVGEQLLDHLQAYGSKFCEWLAGKGLRSDLTTIKEGFVQYSAAAGAISKIHKRLKEGGLETKRKLHFDHIEAFLTWLGSSYIWACYRLVGEEMGKSWLLPDIDETSVSEEDETKLEQLAAPAAKTPEQIILKEEIRLRKAQWIEDFLSFLGQTVQHTHLEAVITTAKGTNPDLELADVVSEVLTFLEEKGKHRSGGDKKRIIELCCSKESETPDRSYNLHEHRLREKWAVFKQKQLRKGLELPAGLNNDNEGQTKGKGDSDEQPA